MTKTFRPALVAETIVNAPIEKVWQCWNDPEDIRQWNNPTPEWHTPEVSNDLRAGGRFLFKMALKDGSFHFDFEGVYDQVELNKKISYTLTDGRTTEILFEGSAPVRIIESFVPENEQPLELQQDFCRSVLDGFKQFVESKA